MIECKPLSITTSMLTWNILAQKYAKPYPWIKPRFMKWEMRRKHIIAFVSKRKYDIICFQEVDLEQVPTDFVDFSGDYTLIPNEISKRRRNPVGNLVLLRKDVWECSDTIHSSTGLHLVLIHIPTKTRMWLSNVHLKAGFNSGEDTRVCQLKSTLRRWKNNGELPAVLCGDFNDNFEEERKLYPILKAAEFTISRGPPSCYAFYRFFAFDHGIGYNIVIEYTSKGRLTQPIPNRIIPSDHYPVAFVATISTTYV